MHTKPYIRLAERNSDQAVKYAMRSPFPTDGPILSRLAIESGGLDRNSDYIYTMWCRDFADTIALAEDDAGVFAFILAYRRPASPQTLFIWQAAVDHRYRGRGVAVRLLSRVVGNRFQFVECTVTPGNTASKSFLARFAAERHAEVLQEPLFGPAELGVNHEPEHLVRIGPLSDEGGGQ